MAESEVYEVDFMGVRSGTSTLTWGQRWIWEEVGTLAPHHAHLNLRMILDTEDSVTLDHVLGALQRLLEEQEALRTTFGTSADGEPQQHLVAQGRLATKVRRVSPKAARRSAYRLAGDLQAVPFEMGELPVRAGVVVVDGRPRHVILVVFHMVADGWSLSELRSALLGLLRPAGYGTAPAAPAGRQPLDQAAWEATPTAQALSERALRFWQRQSERRPAALFPATHRASESPRYTDVCMVSPALGTALPALAERLAVSQTTVYLALVAVVMGRGEKADVCGFTVACRNRTTDQDEAAAGTFVQDAPVLVALGADSFQDVVRRTWNAVLFAYASGAHDPARVPPAGRDFACTVNVELAVDAAPTDAVEQLAQAGKDGTFVSTARFYRGGRDHDRPGRKMYLAANGSGGLVITKIVADTSALGTQAVVDFLTDLEQFAVHALADEGLAPLTTPLPRQWTVDSQPPAHEEPSPHAETPQDGGDEALYQVIVDDQEQYFLLPQGQEVPDGWKAEGTTGGVEMCLAHVVDVVNGLRPLPLSRARQASPVQ
ncbi:condensation domain-containing protein [Streptomyces sp. NBC_00564]|uniref:condensation domain-containing protein n=1 Tax=Streptomyces sp. NBC_00564 TaxID=2903663 RepID=UPI00352F1294|nr:condensation domain-containing protein [Streptomyces sp. NBC_00564]